MMDFGEAVALVEAVTTLSGTICLVDGVHEEDLAVARGVVHPVVRALGALVHMVDHGAMAEEAGAGHGAAPLAEATAALLLEEVSVEELEVALAATLRAAREVLLVAYHSEVCRTEEVWEAHCPVAHLDLVQAPSV